MPIKIVVLASAAEADWQGQPTWDLMGDLQALFAFHFMQNAFLVGTLIALMAGAVGYFMVLRGQSFAGHVLANVGFAGAVGAGLIGWPGEVGLLLFCVGSAIGMDWLGRSSTKGNWGQDVAIGTMQTFALGLGLLFAQWASGYMTGLYGLLFGAVLGISDRQVLMIAGTVLGCLGVLGAIGRPLLFASLDGEVAEARGVPVGGLSRIFLMLLAVAVAQSVQVVGILLIFALLVTPAAIAQQVTAHPGRAIGLSVLLAVGFTWAGLAVAYFTSYPVGFLITSFAFATYGAVRLVRLVLGRRLIAKLREGRSHDALD